MKDSSSDGHAPAQDFKWQMCGNKTILYSESTVNGNLICLDNPNGTSVETIRHLLEEMVIGDVWGANLSNQTFHKQSQWVHRQQILDNQKM
jgi:hypothetical protein